MDDDYPGPEPPAPAEETSDFRAYKNYFRHMYLYTLMNYGARPDCFKSLKATCERRGMFSKIQRKTFNVSELDKIKKLLFNARNSELVLALPSKFSSEFLKYANHWSPVQAYYAIYLAIQAFFRSVRLESPPENHTKSLRTIAEFVTKRNMFPPYWNACCGGGTSITTATYINFPANKKVDQVSCLSTPSYQAFWSSHAMLLRTTRERQFKKKLAGSGNKFETKQGGRRKRFTPGQKTQILTELHATTVFDFLYRVRVRSNYEDADAFILGTISDAEATDFNNALLLFTATTLFILELHVAARVGTQTMGEFISEFRKADKEGLLKYTVGLRDPFLLNK